MKILFFQRWVGVHEGGTETHLKKLAKFMYKRGHQVFILTREGKALRDFDSKVKIFRAGKTLGESDFSYPISDPRLYFYTAAYMIKSFFVLLKLWFRGVRFDLISTHFVTEAKVARVARFLFKVPYIFVIEGYTEREAREAHHANLQICASEHEASECEKNFGYRPLIQPMGVDLGKFKIQNSKLKIRDEFLCLTVARLEPRKDFPTLIKVAKIVREQNPKIKFVIVGEGISERKLKNLVRREGLEKTIHFAGRVSDEDLPKYYQAANLFVLPSLYEGFGIVFLEAMACRLPILSTTVGAVPEVVGDAGVLIEPKNPKLLAEKILWLARDEKTREELAARGLARVREKYDDKKLLKIFEKVCLKVASNA